jgi:hypothetical protein
MMPGNLEHEDDESRAEKEELRFPSGRHAGQPMHAQLDAWGPLQLKPSAPALPPVSDESDWDYDPLETDY